MQELVRIQEAFVERTIQKQPKTGTEAQKKYERGFSASDTFCVLNTQEGSFNKLLQALREESLICLTAGKRGSGKTAFSCAVMDYLQKEDSNRIFGYYFLRFPAELPRWALKAEKWEDILPESRVMLDDCGRLLDNRRSNSKPNVSITEDLQVARHNDHTLLLNLPGTDLLDRRAVGLSDVIFLKQPGFMMKFAERPIIRRMYAQFPNAFPKGQKNNSTVAVMSDYFKGTIKFSPPAWWNEQISKTHRTTKEVNAPCVVNKKF